MIRKTVVTALMRKQVGSGERIRLEQPTQSLCDGSRVIERAERIVIHSKLIIRQSLPDVLRKARAHQHDAIGITDPKRRLGDLDGSS